MSDFTLGIKLETENGQIVIKDLQAVGKGAEAVNKQLLQTNKAGKHAAQGLDKTSASANTLNKSLKKSDDRLGAVILRAHAMAASFITVSGAVQGLGKADSFNVLQQRIETATKATGDYVTVSQDLYRAAQDNHASMQGTVELFQRLSQGREELNATNKDMIQFTDTIQELGVIGGSSAQNMDFGMAQLAQGMSSNIIRAEEYNSLLENIPEVVSRIAKGLGKTRGELRQMMLDGQLMSKDVFDTMIGQSADINAEFKDINVSMAMGYQSFDNALSSSLSRLDQSLGLTNQIAGAFTSVADTLDQMDAQELQDLLATLVAIGGATAAYLVLGKVGLGLSHIVVGGNKAITTMYGLATANAAATKSTYSYNAVSMAAIKNTQTLNVKAKALAATTGVLGRSLALLGGPLGLAAMVGYSLYEMTNASDAAAASLDNLDDKSQKLSPFAAYTYEQASNALQRYNIHLENAVQMAEEARARFKNSFLKGTVDDVKEADKRVEELTEKIAMLQKILQKSGDGKNKDDGLVKQNAQLLALFNKYQKLAGSIGLSKLEQEKFNASFVNAAQLTAGWEQALQSAFNQVKTAELNAALDVTIAKQQQHNSLLQVKLHADEQALNYQKALQEFAAADAQKLELLKEQLAITEELNTALDEQAILAQLDEEIALLETRIALGEEEYAVQKALQKLGSKNKQVNADLKEKVKLQQKLNKELKLAQSLENGEFDAWAKSLMNVGDAFERTGDIVVDTFGNIADQFAKLTTQQEEYARRQEQIDLKRIELQAATNIGDAERQAALANLGQAESDLANLRTSTNLSSYAAISRSAGQMFDEQSKAREYLHKLELAFTAAEIAMSFARGQASAVEGIANQASGDPYSAFARMAAMAGIMVSLGLFGGSVGSTPPTSEQRQKTQGTGTVLGDADAKSESILNALERTEELELDQYVELRAMNAALNTLNANLTRMAASLVGNFGRFDESNYSGELGRTSTTSKFEALAIGMGKTKSGSGLLDKIIASFSSTKKSLVDSGVAFFSQTLGDIIETGFVDAATYAEIKVSKKKFWGLKKSTKYNTEYSELDAQLSAEFALIFESLGESLTTALDVLGLEAANALESFVIDIPHLSLKDLKGDEIEAELQAVFSAQADLMAKHLVPAIGQFQKVGEGLYDTLIRVAQEQAVFNRVLDYTNQSLGGLTGLDMIGASQNIIELAGGIEALADAAQTYYNEFLTESEQFAFVSEQITEQLAALGLTLPTSREGFKELIGSIDLTTESGQALYAALSQLFGQLDEYYDSVEQQAEAEAELAAQRKEFNEDIRRQLMQLNEYELAALDLSDWYENARKQAEELGADTALLEQLYAQKRMALAEEYINAATEKAAQAREAANDAFAEAVDVEVSLYNERIDAINEFSLALSASIAEIRIAMGELTNVDYLSGLENNARENYQSTAKSGTIEEQLSALDELQAAILNRFNAEIAGYDELINTAKSNIDALKAEQQTLTDTFEKAVSNAQRDFDKLAATINKTASSIDAAIYKIESSLPGFDAIGYSNQTINGLYGSLTGEATAEELARINELNSAIAARYQQELNAISASQSAQEKSYSEQLASFNALNNAAKQLKQAADALLISDLSSLTNAAQVDEAKNQFNTLAARARSGDADAMAQLQSVGTRYLELSRSYNPANYDSIFDSVHSVFEELGAGRNIGPAPHPRITAFENKKISLANSTVAELKELKALTAELEQQAKEELAANIAELTNAYKEDSSAIADAIANQELELTELEAAKLLLQQTTVEELEAIKLLLEDLGLEAADERDSAIAALEAKLSADLAEINETLETELAEIRAVFAEEAAAILDVNQAQVIAIEDVKNAIIDTAPPEIQPIDVPWPEPIIKLPQMQQNQIDELRAIRAEIARTNQQQQHALNEAQRQAKQAREDAARSRAELSNMRKEMQKQRAEQVRANNAIEDLAKESNA